MTAKSNGVDTYLEVGPKKTFAGAIEWPGWSRSGTDEASALQALFDYRLRYAKVMQRQGIAFQPPADITDLIVVERLPGGSNTDFGVPTEAPSADHRIVDEAELRRLELLLQAGWQALDAAAQAASGKELRRGPRGGGRELDKIIRHVLEADGGYLSRIGEKVKIDAEASLAELRAATRQAVLESLPVVVAEFEANGGVMPPGPRGGARWSPRYFVRREIWHVLDHAWEIEDRADLVEL